jgi:hypothetical protein
MSFDIQVPGLPLSQHVAMLCHSEGYVVPHTFERVLASGTLQLPITLTDEPLRAYNNRNIGRVFPRIKTTSVSHAQNEEDRL